MRQPAHGFFHIRLWEVCFLALFGLFLADALILPEPYAAMASQRASLISLVILFLQAMQGRRDLDKRLTYPAPQRWPLASLCVCIALDCWPISREGGIAAGVLGAGVCLFVEVGVWRRTHAAIQAHS